MQVNGLPPRGKELELFPGLTLRAPFGLAHARDEDGNLNLYMPWPTPRGYRDGPFEMDDEAGLDWKLTGFRQVFDGTLEVPQAEAAGAVEAHMEEAARNLTENKDQSESDEDRYTYGTRETEDGLTFQADFSSAQAGGSYEKPVTKGNVTLCVVHQRMRVMRLHLTVSHLLIGVRDGLSVRFYIAGLGIPEAEKQGEILQKRLFPLLFGLQFTAPPSLSDLLGKSPEELFPATVRQLDFAAGERVEAGEFAVTIPKGMHYTRTENPQTRCFTAIPQEIPFDAGDYWNYSAVMITLQTGAAGACIHARLNTPEGEAEVKQILRSLRVSGSGGAGQTEAGQTTRAAWDPEYYSCYELLDDSGVDLNFRYYVFTKNFIYLGQYVGKKAGLGPDCFRIHTGVLETYLRNFRYIGGGEKLLEDQNRRALGRWAGSDGRFDALKAVQLFNQDVIFFPEGSLSWDGRHRVFRAIHMNAEKADQFPDVRDNLDGIIGPLKDLISECENNERLRIPAARLGEELRTFLEGGDLTGTALFHLAGYHLFWFREDGEHPGRFSLLLDTRLKRTVPDAENYFRRFLEILRAYNGDPAPAVSGPAVIFRAMDIPDIFGDGGPCLAGDDGFFEDGEDAEAELARVPFDPVSSVRVSGSVFVLTGVFEKNPEDRDEIKGLIEAKGGRCTRSVSGKTDYLVVGALGGYGRQKIEQVQEQRTRGKTMKIIREADLMAALEGRTPPAPKPDPKPDPKPAPKTSVPPVQETGDAKTIACAKRIRTVLSETPMTVQEINDALGTDYGALRIYKAVQLIQGAGTTTVKRRDSAGEKEQSAYYLGGKPAPRPSEPPVRESGDDKIDACARRIRTVLSETPMTVQEINAALGTDYTPLQIFKAVKLIPGAGATIVKRRDAEGEKERSAYYLGDKPKPAPKPDPKPAPKPAPRSAPPAPKPAPARDSGSGSIRIKEVEPKDGEFLRLQVTLDIPGLTDDVPAPPKPSKPSNPSKPSKRPQADDEERKRLQARREAAEREAEAACVKEVKKGEGTRKQLAGRIEKLQGELRQQEQRLQSLGLFQLGEKKQAREEIARLNRDLDKARQEQSAWLGNLEKKLAEIREGRLKAVVEEIRKAACRYAMSSNLSGNEQDAVLYILQALSGTPQDRGGLTDAFFYSFGTQDYSRSMLSKAFLNPFVQNGTLKRIRADGTTETLSGYYL